MVINFWSVILIASASQCVFLILLLIMRPSANKQAQRLLIGLLLVLLVANLHNLWYAGRIYYSVPSVTGFGRGITLLLGPAFYLYARAITEQTFRLKWTQLLHGVPYLFAWVLLSMQRSPEKLSDGIAMVDAFMTTGLKATPLPVTRFVLYVLHILVYIFLARKVMQKAKDRPENYLISAARRTQRLKQVNLVLLAIVVIWLISLIDIFISGYYNFYGNVALTLAFSAFIYLIAYRAVAQAGELLPDFNKKYGSVNIKEDHKTELLPELLSLFENDKVFLNPEIKLADVAGKLNVAPHILTSLINTELGKSFFELLNEYRVQEFIYKSKDPQFAHLSIMGIAQEVGYNSKSSFNTAFKKKTGQTPSQYLKSVD